MSKNKIISGICTVVLMLLVAVVLISFGYDPPDPPIPEEGVEVNIGNSDFGSGDNPQPASEPVTPTVSAAPNQVATQHTEPAPSVNSSPVQGNTVTQQPEPQPVVTPKEPEINRNALFPANATNRAAVAARDSRPVPATKASPMALRAATTTTATVAVTAPTIPLPVAAVWPFPSLNTARTSKVQ